MELGDFMIFIKISRMDILCVDASGGYIFVKFLPYYYLCISHFDRPTIFSQTWILSYHCLLGLNPYTLVDDSYDLSDVRVLHPNMI